MRPSIINPMDIPSFGCVVLTDGSKPERLQAALASLARQSGAEVLVPAVHRRKRDALHQFGQLGPMGMVSR